MNIERLPIVTLKGIAVLLVTLFLMSGCDLFGSADTNFTRLTFLHFTQDNRVFDSYHPGETIVVSAHTEFEDSFFPVEVTVANTRGDEAKVTLRQFRLLSDQDLTLAIQDTHGEAFFRIKEKHLKTAYDREKGEITTSPGTFYRMIEWFNSFENVSVTGTVPSIVGIELMMTPPTAKLVSLFRNHPNIEEFRPNSRARSLFPLDSKLWAANEPSQLEVDMSLLGVFSSAEQEKYDFVTQPGDTITVTYIQSNGETYTAESVIEQE